MLSNPGGPGVSGIAQISTGGKHVQHIVDASDASAEGGLYYDIIGFDPRGVNNTTPKLTCFPNRLVEDDWKAHKVSGRYLSHRMMNLDLDWAMLHASGQACAEQRGSGRNPVHYVNSAQVVEDMVAIVERHAEWREEEAHRLLKDDKHQTTVPETLRWKEGKELLNYWGFSYGTTLGQTFMARYPDRVGRVVLDGIADVESWYSKDTTESLQDTDKIAIRLGEYCDDAGARCPFYKEGKSPLPALYWAQLARSVQRFAEDPLALSTAFGPMVITHDDVMDLLSMMLYEPLNMAEIFTQILDELNHDNTTTLASILPVSQRMTLTDACKRDGAYSAACVRSQSTSWISDAITCTDGEDLTSESKDDFLKYLTELERTSDTMGSEWSRWRRTCINWPARPDWVPHVQFAARTKNTVLALSNTLDTVTPIAFGRKMVSKHMFPNSRLVEVNIEGHRTVASPVLCVGKILRTFFQEGKVPDKGTVCQPDLRPWLGCVAPDGCKSREPVEEALFAALSGLTREWSLARLSGFELPDRGAGQ